MENTDCDLQALVEKMNTTKKKGIICLQNCNTPVVREVAVSLGMKLAKFTDLWDLCWCDSSMDVKRAKDMKKYQKTNHFPGMSEICRKDSLARNLNTMMNYFPEDYDFYPKTWYLPSDYSKVQTHKNQHRSETYILKPTTGCRGTGIYLAKSLKKINRYEQMVCQLYVSTPLLLDGFKFDIRVYALITSCDPLKIYVYNDGLVRLATERYEKPAGKNLDNLFMHLTNYSVNKHSERYVDNEISGSKRRIATLNHRLSNKGYDVTRIWKEIDDVIVKTIILAYPFVNRSYQTYFSGHKYTSACFEILGFDILLDQYCKPHLLEVNHSPDFHTTTAIDKVVKRALLMDTFTLLQLDKTFKKIVSVEEKWKIDQQIKNPDKSLYKQRMLENKEHFKSLNNKWESENLGNYRLVYSDKNSHLYDRFFYWNENILYRVSSLSFRPESPKESNPKPKKNRTLSVKSTSVTRQTSDHIKTHNKIETNACKSLVTNTNNRSIEKKKNEPKKISSTHVEKKRLYIKFVKNICDKTLNRKMQRFPSVMNMYRKEPMKPIKHISLKGPRAARSKSRENIEKIKKKNKSIFPNVQSCIFKKKYQRQTKYSDDDWKPEIVDQTEESDRLSGMLDRSELVFNMDVKDHVYRAFAALNNLNGNDHDNYTKYCQKKVRLGIKPFTFNVINLTFN